MERKNSFSVINMFLEDNFLPVADLTSLPQTHPSVYSSEHYPN